MATSSMTSEENVLLMSFLNHIRASTTRNSLPTTASKTLMLPLGAQVPETAPSNLAYSVSNQNHAVKLKAAEITSGVPSSTSMPSMMHTAGLHPSAPLSARSASAPISGGNLTSTSMNPSTGVTCVPQMPKTTSVASPGILALMNQLQQVRTAQNNLKMQQVCCASHT